MICVLCLFKAHSKLIVESFAEGFQRQQVLMILKKVFKLFALSFGIAHQIINAAFIQDTERFIMKGSSS